MTRSITAVLAFFGFAVSSALAATQAPGYAGQESRDIKALSADEIDGYLAGKGMGFAKAAELNGYPGPAHVLELAAQLELSADQRRRTEALFANMQARAMALGRSLVDAERALDRLFAGKTVTPASLAEALDRIAVLQGKVRAAHLDAHLAQAAILAPGQIAHYMKLRGYARAPDNPGAPPHGAHRHAN
jgi:hypothetical protein